MPNVVIIGGGPAGISASLYIARAGIPVSVLARDGGSLEKTDKIENYYGFAEPVSGAELIEHGLAQARRLGVELIVDEAVGLGFGDKLEVKTSSASYSADCVILATGSRRKAPALSGISQYEGKGVSYCAQCDAFFYKGRDVAVLGNGRYALSEALELSHIASSVTILTGGQQPDFTAPDGVRVDDRAVSRVLGEDTVSGVEFADGETLAVSGVFVAFGVAGSADFAKKLGAQTDGARIVVDENMATGVPGLYAAGDCTGGLLQIAKAVCDGAKAGTSAIKYVRSLGE